MAIIYAERNTVPMLRPHCFNSSQQLCGIYHFILFEITICAAQATGNLFSTLQQFCFHLPPDVPLPSEKLIDEIKWLELG